ncbi:MAG: peptidase M28, partial [Bacteroidales bacterium]|nr:peptidase M28 [Bacteroidales bacterium]
MKRIYTLLATALLATGLSLGAFAQDKVVKKIIETGTTDNRTMEHADFLINRIGGRIVGSAALTEAEAWVKEQFESWGLEVMVQEAGEINVGFNRGPWYGRMLSEDGMNLHFGTPSYTAGTKGKQTGHVVLEPKNQRDFNRMKGVLKGAWVLLDAPTNGLALDWREQTDTLFYHEMVDAGVLGFIRSAAVPLRILYDRAHCYDITMETLPTVC